MYEPAAGTLIADRFEVERRIGRGGMGTVYGARDAHSGRHVALKLMNPSGDDAVSTRFARESHLLSELVHPGIVSYVAHGKVHDGMYFLAMEWLDGEELALRLTRGRLAVQEAILLMRRVADALSFAHERGIVHRDLKPSNLFLEGGRVEGVKLLDFGVARQLSGPTGLTRTGMLLGTPAYMSPEQARGEQDVGPEADVFALGCVLYQCLTGEQPFGGEHVVAVLMGILRDEPVRVKSHRPEVGSALADLVHRMLAKDPKARPCDACTLAQALAALDELDEIEPQSGDVAGPGSFVQSEQFLYSVVVAAPPSDPDSETLQLGKPHGVPRSALESGVHGLGAQVDFLVDGTVVVTLPRTESATDQAALAARAALLLKEHWPDAAIGLATGRGALRGEMAVGEVVERAARLLRAGPRGSVCLDDLSASLLKSRFVVTPAQGGLTLGRQEAAVDESRPLLGKPTPCVGRDAELSSLEGQLTGCIEESDARAIVVTAPPGAGKSRLRHEFLRRVARRDPPVTVLCGLGELLNSGAAYGILGRAILGLAGVSGSDAPEDQRRKLRERIGMHVDAADRERVVVFVGELCGVPFPDEASPLLRAARQDLRGLPDRLRQAALDWLAAECRAAPVLLVLDDLQWADELTVELVDTALHELQGAPFCVLALGRADTHTLFPNLWRAHKRQDLALKGLSKRACERLFRQILGEQLAPEAAARLIEQAGGNALFLEELIRAAAEGKTDAQPETVIAMLQARVGRFETGPRRAALAASVFGQAFWLGGVATVLGLSKTDAELEAWIETLIEAEMIQPHKQSQLTGQREYGFRHAQVRDAVYGLLTEDGQRIGHTLAAAFLERADKQISRAILAHHLRLAGLLDKALSYYLEAGEQAAQLYLHEEARMHFTAADETIERLPDSPERRRQHVDVLLKRVHSGMTGSVAIETQREALERARSLLESLANPALAEDADRLRLARVDYYLGRIYIYAGQSAAAAPYFARVLDVARAFGDRELVALASMFPGLGAAMNGQMGKARDALKLAMGPMEQFFGHSIDTLRCCTFLAAMLCATGQVAAAKERIVTAERWVTQSRQPAYAGLYQLVRAIADLFAADWSSAIHFGELSCDYSTKGGQAMHHYMALDVMAWSKSHVGRHEEAIAIRAEAASLRRSLGRTLGEDWFEAGEAEILLNAGRVEDALAKAQLVAKSSLAAGLYHSLAVADRVCGCAKSRLGASQAEVEAHLGASLAVCRQNEMAMHAIQAKLWWGRICRERGDERAAKLHLDEAFASLEAGGYQHARDWGQRIAGGP
jgi:tetratricopeptide (TPR) repeat protein